jgi:hypothetical protein
VTTKHRKSRLAGGAARAPPWQGVVVRSAPGDHGADAGDPIGQDRAVALVVTEGPLDEAQPTIAHGFLGRWPLAVM